MLTNQSFRYHGEEIATTRARDRRCSEGSEREAQTTQTERDAATEAGRRLRRWSNKEIERETEKQHLREREGMFTSEREYVYFGINFLFLIKRKWHMCGK
jgi:hypothetical protein